MITYIDTSVLLKLLVDDEVGADAAQRLWLDSDFVMCAEIGYAEARAALASVRRGGRLDARELSTAKAELNRLWAQVDVVPVTTELVLAAGDLAEAEGLRGYDADTVGAFRWTAGVRHALALSDTHSVRGRLGVRVPPGAHFFTDQDVCGMSPATYLGNWPELTQPEVDVRYRGMKDPAGRNTMDSGTVSRLPA